MGTEDSLEAPPPVLKLEIEKNSLEIEENSLEQDELTLWHPKTHNLALFLVSWISIIMGYTYAYTNNAFITDNFPLSDVDIIYIENYFLTAATIGAACSGILMKILGRKWTLMVTNLILLVSWVLCLGNDVNYVISARLCIGLGIGVGFMVIPFYIAEVSPRNYSGSLVIVPFFMANIGFTFCYMFLFLSYWENLALMIIFLCVLYFLAAFFFLPDTPTKSEMEEKFLGLKVNTTNKFETLCEFIQKRFKLYFTILILIIFQQMLSKKLFSFHATKFLGSLGFSFDTDVCIIIVGVANFISTFQGTLLVEKIGRWILFYIFTITIVIYLMMLGFFEMKTSTNQLQNHSLSLVNFWVYNVSFSFGLGSVPSLVWIEIKATTSIFVVLCYWAIPFVVTGVTPYRSRFFDSFYLYFSILLFTHLCLGSEKPEETETKNKPVLDKEKILDQNKSNYSEV